MNPVVIAGGGISGLATAWYLARAGVRSVLVERRPRLGGVISTETVEGCIVEGGPDSFLAAKPWAMDLIRELGIADEVIGSNDHQRVTYIRRRGRLVALPEGLMMIAPTRIAPIVSTPLFSWPTKVRMGLEWFRRPPRDPRDRSVAEFITEHYGREALDYLAEPLLAGVYGGDPDLLSAQSVLPRFVELERAYGSVTRGVLVEGGRTAGSLGGGSLFRTLRGGMSRLVAALSEKLRGPVEVRHGEVEAIEPGYRARVAGDWIAARAVVLACPAYEAARLVRSLDGELATLLEGVVYNSSMTVALGYDGASIAHPMRGFGFLVPRRERRRLVACTWVGNKFAHRVPEGMALLRCFLGGESAESDEALAAVVGEELREIMGVAAAPRFARVSRWPRSMAQYTVGHAARLAAIGARMERLPGLALAGNGYQGIGVPDCVRSGQEAAARVAGQSV
jgi:oxygen-dependent protoporphyrinogen oxidase